MKKTKRLIICMLLIFILCVAGGCGKKKSESSKKELSFSEIEEMARDGLFNVYWHTGEGDFSAGTSFLMDSEEHGEKILVTAFHYLWPDNAAEFKGSELQRFVTGGELYYAVSGEDSGAKLRNNIVIVDADAVPTIEKDVAAFTLTGAENLKTMKLSDRKPKKGETIYLLARLWDGEVINKNCVYECKVVSCDDDVISYKIDSKYGSTMGASGGPLVDKYGEVVGMHMAGDIFKYYGHYSTSFAKQIHYGFVSDITYK